MPSPMSDPPLYLALSMRECYRLTRPQRFNAQQPLSTTLFSHEPTLEFTTRLAKLITRRAQLPVYVTNSVSFADAGMGGTVEEEMEAFKSIVEVTLERLRGAGIGSTAASAETQSS